jgi:hypothetical protein
MMDLRPRRSAQQCFIQCLQLWIDCKSSTCCQATALQLLQHMAVPYNVHDACSPQIWQSMSAAGSCTPKHTTAKVMHKPWQTWHTWRFTHSSRVTNFRRAHMHVHCKGSRWPLAQSHDSREHGHSLRGPLDKTQCYRHASTVRQTLAMA